MSAANELATATAAAANGTRRVTDHPTILQIQAKAKQFSEAMPTHFPPDRFMRIAIGAIRKTPKLLECDVLSLMGSLLVAAQLGLEPNSPLQQFYLIPRFNGKTKRMECDGQIGYKGWLELLSRTDAVASIVAEVVHEQDQFHYQLGDDPLIQHIPHIGERGKSVAYYVSVKLKTGGVYRKVLSREDVQKFRARSQSPNAGPWVNDFDAMALKTTFLRLVTWLPKSIELNRAAAYENTLEAGGQVRYSESHGQLEYDVPDPSQAVPQVIEAEISNDSREPGMEG